MTGGAASEPASVLKPSDGREVAAVVEWAVGAGKSLEIVGHGTRRAIGRAAQWDLTLDLSGLTGITLYEPAELVLSARAGTPMAEIAAALADAGQELAFEPMDCGPILGHSPGRGTLGGAIAAGLSGPRRVKAGAARDHVLGIAAVSGRGESFKSGGRVVKNVTGYDLGKLLTGSWGTLAAMTEITVKVLPRAETEATLLVLGLDAAAAVAAMAAAMASAAEVSAAAHVPREIAVRLGDPGGGLAATALRLEGVAPSVAHRCALLERLLRPSGSLAVIDAAGSRSLWQAIRDATSFAVADPLSARPLWRISTVPSRAPAVVAAVAAEAEIEVLYDWAGGLVWMSPAPCDDAAAPLIRRAVADAGGHATLIRAPLPVRAAVAVFPPQDDALAALTRRVKASFDPKGVLGPGRLQAGL